jgi:hypothetical protein
VDLAFTFEKQGDLSLSLIVVNVTVLDLTA